MLLCDWPASYRPMTWPFWYSDNSIPRRLFVEIEANAVHIGGIIDVCGEGEMVGETRNNAK